MPGILLLADADGPRRQALAAALLATGVAQRVVECDSGRMLVGNYVRLLRASAGVVGVVLETQLPVGGGKSSAIAIRAVEKGFGAAAVQFVFHTAAASDANLERVLAYLGRASHHQRVDGADPATQAAGIAAGIEPKI